MASSTISSKGQITVPLEIRKRLGLKEGDRVEFIVDRDQTILRPARSSGNPFERFIGVLPSLPDDQSAVAWTRSLRDPESSNQ